MKKRRLVVSTETFPYGKGEKPFLKPEIDELSKYFDVTICSHANECDVNDTENLTTLSSDVKVVNLNINMNFWRRIVYGILYILDKDARKEIKDIFSQKTEILRRVYQSIGFFALAMENLRLMKKKHLLYEDTLYYSFWFYYYTYSMVRYKAKDNNIKVVTKAHGFDLYNERYTGGRQPFKKIMFPNIDKIFFVSFAGQKYYKEHFEHDIESKGRVCRLGTAECVGRYIIKPDRDIFNLVSCSNVIPLKRVELIVEALALLKEEKIRWTHFGGGESFNQLEECARRLLKGKDNISYMLMGPTDNNKVLEYYQEHPVHCFITTSSTEGGTPMSIMEAMSAGIPIIGTNVGGIPEMLDGNGVLLSPDPTAEEIAKAISDMYSASYERIKEMRDSSYNIWKNNFCFKNNIIDFIEALQDVYETVN